MVLNTPFTLSPCRQFLLHQIFNQKAAETIIYMASAKELNENTGKYFFDKKEIESSPNFLQPKSCFETMAIEFEFNGS